MGDITATLAQFVSETHFDDLPGSVVQKIKEVLLDSIGCALGGYATERGKIAIELSESFGEKPEATIIGYKKVASPNASFVNGELINCLDYDVLGPIGGHVAPYVIPPTLALSEKTGKNGKDLITALAIALEVGGRMLASLSHLKVPKSEPPYYEEAPRFSYTSVIFGAVAGACKSLRVNEETVRSAFGIGGTSTPIPGGQKWEYLEGANVNLKYGCWAGWIAMLGTVAAMAAQRGFTGDPTILDGKYGFWQMYGSPFFKEDVLTNGLRKIWHIERINFKFYPCCYIDHTSIEAIEQLVQENDISPEEIDEIIVYGDPLMLTPNRWPEEIRTQEDCQFAHAYLFALAATQKGKPGPNWQLPDFFNDPQVKNLMPKVKVKPHPQGAELTADTLKKGSYSSFRNIVAEISARGKKFTMEVAVAKGEPLKVLTTAELEGKFRHNASYSWLKKEKGEQAIEAVWNLDQLASITELTDALGIGTS
ncbi:MmgE/PrpD family protein [Thermodesulfobacteriota bacterium]